MISCSTPRTLPRAIAFVVLVFAFAAASVEGQTSLTIPNVSANGAQPVNLGIALDNTTPVQGFILAVGFDTAQLSVLDFGVAGTVTQSVGAELVSAEIFEAAGGATLGVILDTMMPFDGQTIPVGSGQVIAGLQVQGDQVPAVGSVTTPVSFVDGVFNSPVLDNLVVLNGGIGVGAAGGLGLNNGSVEIFAAASAFNLVGVTLTGAETAAARVLLDAASGGVQGYVTAVTHDPNVLTLVDININGSVAVAVGAELVVENILGNGGTLGVVLDFEAPFQGQVIPDGTDQLIANYVYTCTNPIIVTGGGQVPPSTFTSIQFQNGVLGSPALDNVIVGAGGLSVNPILGGPAVVECAPFVDNGPGAADTSVFCGVQDPNGNIVDAVASPGGTTQLCFYYTEGNDNGQGCIGNNIQGFQLGLTFDCQLSMVQGSFSVAGTILDFVGTEFVDHSVDNNANDGDGCELTIGILLDALPPFDGQTLPPACDPQRIGCIDVVASPNAPCNTDLAVTFTNGVNGSEAVPINNVVAINNQGFGINTFNCNVRIEAAREFVRGDCNFDNFVNIADAAAIVSLQFQGAMFPCFDACDSNDDGFINLADTVFLLSYLFDSGPIPPEPGPDLNDGADPTPDFLSCVGGNDPCP